MWTRISGLLVALAMAATHTVRADDWQRLADQIPHVNYGDFLYGRPERVLDGREAHGREAIQAATRIDLGLQDLEELARHPDPRVRTLALMKCHVSGEPQAFRIIHSRLKDEEASFPALSIHSLADFSGEANAGARPVPVEAKKVGDVARMMLDMLGYRINEDFEAWAAPRLGNPDWLGWYEFLLKRVTQGTSPTPRGIDEALAGFERLLAARPPAVRAWLGFVAADEAMSLPSEDTVLGRRDELLAAGKSLGPEALLDFLKSGRRAGLQNPKVDHPTSGSRFILRNAKELFREEDAEELLEIGHYIAAADLRPEMASVWLRQAMKKWSSPYQGWDRARAMAALLHLRGEREVAFVVDWFHAAEVVSQGTSDQSVFISEYSRRRPADWRHPVTALVAHPGFSRIKALDLIYLAQMVNDFDGRNPIDAELLTESGEEDLRNAIRRCLGLPEHPLVWVDLNEGEQVDAKWSVPLEGRAVRLAVSPDGTLVAIGTSEGAVSIRRTADGESLAEIPADVRLALMAFRAGDGKLMIARGSGKFEIWNPDPFEMVDQMEIEGLATEEGCADPAGKWLATRRANGFGVSVHDLSTGALRWNMKTEIRAFGLIGASPDGLRFAVCDGFIRSVLLFDPAQSQPVARLDGHSAIPCEVAFATDGSALVTTGTDMKILIWNGKNGEKMAEFASRQPFPRVLACSGDSTGFLFGGGRHGLARADIRSGRVSHSFQHGGRGASAALRCGSSVLALVEMQGGGVSLVAWNFPVD
jgi:hypothetical protein